MIHRFDGARFYSSFTRSSVTVIHDRVVLRLAGSKSAKSRSALWLFSFKKRAWFLTDTQKTTDLARPATIDEVCARLANFRSAEAAAAQLAHQARADDVYVSTYSKSGTTWMQQIVHQLRSQCSTDFEEISCVVPWLESAVDMGIDPHADQPYAFRAFKCHLLYCDLPKGGRYITVFRDPLKVLSSFYRFFSGWWFEEGTINIDEFAAGLYLGGSASGRHWDHLVDWWQKKDSADTLMLSYEDMILSPDRAVEVVAEFLQLELHETTLECAKTNSSREYMLRNASQFDEHVLRDIRDKIWGLPPGGGSGKVVSNAIEISPSTETLDAMQQTWDETVGELLGFKDYQSLRCAMPNLLDVDRNL